MDLVTADALDPAKLVVLVLGVGNAFTRRSFNTSFLLLAGGQRILVDAPAPMRRILGDSGVAAGLDLDIPEINRIILTHLHGDHCNGVEEAGFFRMFVAPDAPKAALHLLPRLVEPLWRARLSAVMDSIAPEGGGPEERMTLADYFDVQPWAPGEHVIPTPHGPIRVRVHEGNHSVPCIGIHVEFNGQTFAYSGDTAFVPEHVEFLAPAQLVVHEAGVGYGHTPIEKLQALDPALRARMGLVHFPESWRGVDKGIALMQEGALYHPPSGPVPVPIKSLLRRA